jgi:hypothetical protein
VFLLYFALCFSPQRFQILYWRSGVHYSFTIILGLYILALITTQMVRDHASRRLNYLVAPLAFFAGGLSETGAVYLFTGMILLLAVAWLGKRNHQAWADKSLPSILVAVVGLLIAMITLIVSPSNDRYQSMGVRSTNLMLVPFLSFKYSFAFILDSLKSLPLPHLIFIVFFVALSVLQELFLPFKDSVNFQKKNSFSHCHRCYSLFIDRFHPGT